MVYKTKTTIIFHIELVGYNHIANMGNAFFNLFAYLFVPSNV